MPQKLDQAELPHVGRGAEIRVAPVGLDGAGLAGGRTRGLRAGGPSPPNGDGLTGVAETSRTFWPSNDLSPSAIGATAEMAVVGNSLLLREPGPMTAPMRAART
jgi:hypothetical protein